jgi:hypothetical protein
MNIDRSALTCAANSASADSPGRRRRLKSVFDEDWSLSHHYDPPDPLDPASHIETDFPHDPELMHE